MRTDERRHALDYLDLRRSHDRSASAGASCGDGNALDADEFEGFDIVANRLQIDLDRFADAHHQIVEGPPQWLAPHSYRPVG